MSEKTRGAGALGFVAGFLFAVAVIVVAGFVYLKMGHLPVAASDPAFPMEKQIVHVPMKARIEREMQTPPIAADEANFEAGAHIYKAECSHCHGVPGQAVDYAKWMYPSAPQLWQKHKNGAVGVSDDEAGETFWKVKNGLRLTGMPAYQKLLSETQMWQVSLLLKNADQNLSPAVQEILNNDEAVPAVH